MAPSAGADPIHPGVIQRGQGKLDEAVKAGSTRASPHAAQGWHLKSSQALDRGGARGLTGVKWCWPFSLHHGPSFLPLPNKVEAVLMKN